MEGQQYTVHKTKSHFHFKTSFGFYLNFFIKK